jgi:hypothetical protein
MIGSIPFLILVGPMFILSRSHVVENKPLIGLGCTIWESLKLPQQWILKYKKTCGSIKAPHFRTIAISLFTGYPSNISHPHDQVVKAE